MDNPVLIVGGGIGGLAAALSFAQQGFNVAVFEQAARFAEVGAGIQLSPNPTRVLHSLGLAEALEREAFLPDGTEFRDWKTGRIISTNRLGQWATKEYGAPYYHMHRADLIQILADAAAAEPRIALHTGLPVNGFRESAEGVVAHTGAGDYEGSLLIGADGIHSTIRTALFGPESPVFTGNVAWRGLIPADRFPDGMIPPVAGVWWGPGKHFVHYYVRRGELVNCVCVVEKAGWEVESWNERGDHSELKRDFTGWHPMIQTLIDRMDPDACFKWALFDRPPMESWGRGRVTLLGDACHPTLPFMAQGAAMAIEDGAVLARCLAAGDAVVEGLERYQSLRQSRTAGIQNGSRRNASVFHMRGIKAWARNRAAKRAGSAVVESLYRYDALTVVAD